jgi:hypothetical protein
MLSRPRSEWDRPSRSTLPPAKREHPRGSTRLLNISRAAIFPVHSTATRCGPATARRPPRAQAPPVPPWAPPWPILWPAALKKSWTRTKASGTAGAAATTRTTTPLPLGSALSRHPGADAEQACTPRLGMGAGAVGERYCSHALAGAISGDGSDLSQQALGRLGRARGMAGAHLARPPCPAAPLAKMIPRSATALDPPRLPHPHPAPHRVTEELYLAIVEDDVAKVYQKIDEGEPSSVKAGGYVAGSEQQTCNILKACMLCCKLWAWPAPWA